MAVAQNSTHRNCLFLSFLVEYFIVHSMSGFELLKHHQLHEVLFAYLDTNHLLDCRCIGSECDEMVVRYAQGQLQDVLGQDLSQGCLPGLDGDMVCDNCSSDCSLRTVNASLVKLLLVCGEGLGQSATGVCSLSADVPMQFTKPTTHDCYALA